MRFSRLSARTEATRIEIDAMTMSHSDAPVSRSVSISAIAAIEPVVACTAVEPVVAETAAQRVGDTRLPLVQECLVRAERRLVGQERGGQRVDLPDAAALDADLSAVVMDGAEVAILAPGSLQRLDQSGAFRSFL